MTPHPGDQWTVTTVVVLFWFGAACGYCGVRWTLDAIEAFWRNLR